MSRDDDKDEKRSRTDHGGSVAPEDAELALWLNRLWARNEPPSRIEVWQMFGRNKAVRGEMIHHEDFKHGEKLDIEQATKLSNEIIEAAQNDCDSTRREAWYQIAVIDHHRKSNPLVRRLGPLQPKRAYAIAKAGDETEEDDDQGDIKATNLKYVQEGLAQARWDKQRYDRVMGEMLILQDSIIKQQQSQIDRMFDKQMTFFEKLQEAEDRRLDRDVVRAKEQFKIEMWQDGMRTARNLLPGLFAAKRDESRSALPDEGQHDGGNGNNGSSNGSAAKQYGPSEERALVDNFLTDVERDEKLSVALFGDFEEREGKLALVKPGIFSIKQYSILLKVRDGMLPPGALDQMMPDSGEPLAITQEQVQKAIGAGVTDGIGMALFELMGLRNRRRAEKQNNETGDQP